MPQPLTLLATLGTATAALGACAPQAEVSEDRGQPVHAGIRTIPLDDDMVSAGVALRGPADRAGVEAHGASAICAGSGIRVRAACADQRKEGRAVMARGCGLPHPGRAARGPAQHRRRGGGDGMCRAWNTDGLRMRD